MKLSAPFYLLKRRARLLAHEESIALHSALDRIAVQEGYRAWSDLAAQHASEGPASKLFRILQPGELALIAARPGLGKTLLGLELCCEAAKLGQQTVFFTLEYTQAECNSKLKQIGSDASVQSQIVFDCSDKINAEYIISRVKSMPPETLAVVDYLQLLDQKRTDPPLQDQVSALRSVSCERRAKLVFLSQVDRSFTEKAQNCPDVTDVRLPNHLDLRLFDRMCFIGQNEVRFA